MVTKQLPPTALGPDDPDDGDAGRQSRGVVIAAKDKIEKNRLGYKVPSQSHNGSYVVSSDGDYCTCPDFEKRQEPCKHVYAVELVAQRDGDTAGGLIAPGTQPLTYQQDWPAYNTAQQYEEELFGKLLRELCDTIEQLPQGKGRPRFPLADMVFAAGLKVYSEKSSRRAMTSIRNAHALEQLEAAPSFNSILRYLKKPELTPLLEELIVKSALPLKAVEQDIAVDSSGFSTSVYDRWFDHKWGKERAEAQWVKAHIACGVRTNIITAVKVAEGHANDTRYFLPLLDATSANFDVREVSGDKAYLSKRNLAAVAALGAQAYIPFKVNSTAEHGHHKRDPLWEKAYHYYHLHREQFLAHYHKRSNVETAFHMIKAKFGAAVRAKTFTAQVNEVLVKILCHNIVVLIQSMYELGTIHVVWSEALHTQN